MNGGTGRTVLGASTATLISRIVGFGRNIALTAALGTGLVSDSYNIANQVPNQIFLLLGGGTIAAVFLPQLAKLRVRSPQAADRYGTALLIGSAVFGVVASSLMIVLAPQLVLVMGGQNWGTPQQQLTVVLFLWCIPQVAAYSVFVVASQLMNARGKFALVSWLPSISSISVIIASVIVITQGVVDADDPASLSPSTITVLGAFTLGGTVLQTVVLLLMLPRVGFRPRMLGGIRGLGLRAAVATGALAVASAMCYQVTNLLTAAWTSQAGAAATELGYEGRGYSAFFYAMALMSVVQGVAVASLASILLQRMSHHLANGDDEEAHRELDDASIRLASVTIPATMIFVSAGPALAEILFARGETSVSAARVIGITIALLAVGLVPYTWHALLIRPFYARHDALRPLLSAITVNLIWIAGAVLSSLVLPPQFVVFGMALTFALSYWMDLPVKLRWLHRRLSFRMSHQSRRDMATAGVWAAALTLCIGVPGWIVLYTAPPTIWVAMLVVGTQFIALMTLYLLGVRRRSTSPAALLRWLKK